MKKSLPLLLAAMLLTAACNEQEPNDFVELHRILAVGEFPNQLVQDEDYVYLVDSGNNTIHRLDKTTTNFEHAYIDLGSNQNPYALYVDKHHLYVVNSLGRSVIKVPKDKPSQKTVLADSSSLVSPSDVLVHQNVVYIADSEFNLKDSSKTGGKILIIDAENKQQSLSFLDGAETALVNPISMRIIPNYHGQPQLAVSYAGVTTWVDDKAVPPKESCLALIPLTDISKTELKPKTFCVQDQSLGLLSLGPKDLFIGSGNKGEFYSLPLEGAEGIRRHQVRDTSQATVLTPLALSQEAGKALVLDLNADALFACDIAQSPSCTKLKDFREQESDPPLGPLSLVYDEKEKDLYILHTFAKLLDRYDYDPKRKNP